MNATTYLRRAVSPSQKRTARRMLGSVADAAELPRAWSRRLAYESRMLRAKGRLSPLAAAASRGDTSAVERLLRDGTDIDARDARGMTALHHAVARGHADVAALLLVRGVDPHLVDAEGRQAMSLDFTSKETLHAVRLRYHRLRSADDVYDAPASDEVLGWARELEQKGVVRVSGLVSADELPLMRAGFARFVAGLDAKVAAGEGVFSGVWEEEEHWRPQDRVYVTNNAFKHSNELAKLCLDSSVIGTVRRYLGRNAFVQRALGFRYLPDEHEDDMQFAWHHDMGDKRIKIMVLLTDVGKNDQYMSYVIGSHRLYHPHRTYIDNKLSLTPYRKQLGEFEYFKATGKAGDAFFFDPNGIHRGNRNPGATTRDAYILEFSSDTTNTWGGDVDPSIFNEGPVPEPNPFERLLAAEKRWEAPPAKVSTWVTSLPEIDSWL
ncbi:MAG TPA: ankyrin repeat domain-containing protein [Dehalococcoidia bacterium]|nr:ankyrin repeat domain-containing protein [Dehalococcoidia bacterium]